MVQSLSMDDLPDVVNTSARDELLHRVMAHVRANGVTETSLRQIADAIGSSHRMLLYHFGSREGLLTDVIRAVEADQRARWRSLPADLDQIGVLRRMWRHFTRPELEANERLFFEIYGQALQGRDGATELLDGIVDDWVDPVAAAAVRRGVPKPQARADARLAVAVVRGLLLDLLATGDRRAVNAAFERYVTLVAAPETERQVAV